MINRNIADLNLDDITEEYLQDECIEMGDALEVDTRQGSIYRDASDGHVYRTAKFFDDLRQIAEIISINSCSGEVLDEKLMERGLARNPEAATPASYYVEFVGAEPNEGDRVSCDDHFFVLSKSGDRWIMTSEETGTDMNLIVSGLPVIPEIDVDELISATVLSIAAEAEDEEEDESARARLLAKISGPSENGNKSQIKSRCEEVEGVGRAKIIPLWNGNGTVKAIIISKEGVIPSSEVVEAVQEYIDPDAEGMGEGVAPIGCHFTAAAATQTVVNISVSVTKKSDSTLSTIQETIQTDVKKYLKELALSAEDANFAVRYNSIGAIIAQITDIVDYDNLLLNSGTDNIACTVYQVPVLGEVTVNGNI